MTQDPCPPKPHSADEFVSTRDHWWRGDQIAAVAKELRFERIRSVLDVGCGLGHWTRVLASVVPEHATFTGVDAEPSWIDRATELMATLTARRQFKFQVGAAESLAFPDASFDLVTCQTLLMHVRDPGAVLREMVRVARAATSSARTFLPCFAGRVSTRLNCARTTARGRWYHPMRIRFRRCSRMNSGRRSRAARGYGTRQPPVAITWRVQERPQTS